MPSSSPARAGASTYSAIARHRGPAVFGLSLFALALASEYRLRISASASVAELGAYVAIVALMLEPVRTSVSAGLRRVVFVFGLLVLWLLLRAFIFRIFRSADIESAFSHIRDVCVPIVVAILGCWRVRLSERGRGTVTAAFLFMGALTGAAGISQFFHGWPYLFDGIDIIRYKTLYAQKYWIAELFHMQVENLARGFYGFSIAYACSLVIPAIVAFSLAWGARGRRRVIYGALFFVIYAGIYFSFSRSVLGVVPFGCFAAALAMMGWLGPWTCVAMVTGYIGIALVGPLIHLRDVSDADINTLSSRVGTLAAFAHHVSRDDSTLLLGSTVRSWREWNGMSPHNWAVNALLVDGVLGAALRVGTWLGLLIALFPSSGGRRAAPLAAGLWAGAFTLLFIVGETEPFNGISEYLMAGFALALLGTIHDSGARPAQPSTGDRPRKSGTDVLVA